MLASVGGVLACCQRPDASEESRRDDEALPGVPAELGSRPAESGPPPPRNALLMLRLPRVAPVAVAPLL